MENTQFKKNVGRKKCEGKFLLQNFVNTTSHFFLNVLHVQVS